MNILFILVVAILMLMAFALVLPPVWRGISIRADDMDQRNILIARNRLAELKANWLSGGISLAQYDEQVAELERTLLDDLSIKSPISASPLQGRWMAGVLIVAIPLLSGALYWTLGNYQAVSHSAEMAVAVPANPGLDDINNMVAGLAERLKTNPDDAEGWLMLGKSYKYLEHYPKAVEAFANAYRLKGDQPEVMLLYADAIAFASGKNLAGKPTELIFKALAMEPDNMNGLWLGGLAKVQQGDTAGALTLWRKLESLLPPDSDSRREMQDVIAKLPGQTRASADQQQTPSEARVSPSTLITVEVSLAPELRQSTSPGDTVFIYAQALSGPKMPLAITRKQVADLPVTVSLNDTMAMMPAMKLSNFTEVKLLARISKSGQAVTQPGDLIGTIEKIAVAGSSSHKILINKRLE